MKVVQVQVLFFGQLEDSSWGSDNDVRWLVSLEDLDIFSLWHSSKEHFRSDIWRVFGESQEFLLDLVGQLSGVAKDKSGVWLGVLVQLLEDREDKDSSLSHSGDGLADDVSSND